MTLLRVALRSLFLEASWSRQGQQNLGLAAAIDPALKEIYGGPRLGEARQRAFSFFNTNPIASGLVLGIIIRLEEEVAVGRRTAENRIQLGLNLCRGLAGLGDMIFWESWLPLCCVIAVWTGLSLGYWWTPLLLPLLFCLPALPVRFLGLAMGYRRGEEAIYSLARCDVQRLITVIRLLLAFVVGASTTALVASQAMVTDGGPGLLWLTLIGLVICAFLLKVIFQKFRRLSYWYPLVLVIVACVLLTVVNYN
jgi:Phosphotransferase system, mannose/fructose/N-acetylgalactosamine-specific component IID